MIPVSMVILGGFLFTFGQKPEKFHKMLDLLFLFAIITEQQAGLIPHLEQLSKKVRPARGT